MRRPGNAALVAAAAAVGVSVAVYVVLHTRRARQDQTRKRQEPGDDGGRKQPRKPKTVSRRRTKSCARSRLTAHIRGELTRKEDVLNARQNSMRYSFKSNRS